jgi:hypothetical protein
LETHEIKYLKKLVKRSTMQYINCVNVSHLNVVFAKVPQECFDF